MTKKLSGRQLYPAIDISGLDEESQLSLVKALAEAEKQKVKSATHV